MKEALKYVCSQLPKEGVAIHGTNFSRARSIQKNGFNPNIGPDNRTFYNVQPCSLLSFNRLSEEIFAAIELSAKHSFRATSSPIYAFSNDRTDSIPAFVVFKPPITPYISEHGYPTDFAHEQETKTPILGTDIYGVVILENPTGLVLPKEKARYYKKVVREIGLLLAEKGVIYLPAPLN